MGLAMAASKTGGLATELVSQNDVKNITVMFDRDAGREILVIKK